MSEEYRPERLIAHRTPSGLWIGDYLDEPGLIVMERSIGELHGSARELLPVFRHENAKRAPSTDG